MKLHYKIILLPILVMIGIFTVSLVTIEYQQRNLLQEKLAIQLKDMTSFALAAVDLVNYSFDVNDSERSLDTLADKIAKASSYRISYIYLDGQLLGDSQLTFTELTLAENHADRPEIQAAIADGYGQAQRYSTTIKQGMFYFAKYDRNTGIIARVAMPLNSYQTSLLYLRWSFSVIFIITLAVMVFFGVVAINLIRSAVKKERLYHENIIVNRTRENTLIQAMATMLNAAHSMDDASRLLLNILPKLFPQLSGSIYIANKDNLSIKELTCWGEPRSNDVSMLASTYLQKQIQNEEANQTTNLYFQQLNNRDTSAYWLNLSSEKRFFGLLYLANAQGDIDDETRSIANNIAEQIAFALSNLCIKDALRNQAIRDPLTDLYNRRFMIEAFEQALNRADRQQANLAILMLDLDHFKSFNDKFGHDAGDLVLVKVAESFKNNLRLEDIACRYGGEEFCIISPDTSLKDAYVLADKLRLCINNLQIEHQGKNLGCITTSIGIAIYPNHANSVSQLINMADKAMYLAKESGRNCVVVHQNILVNQNK